MTCTTQSHSTELTCNVEKHGLTSKEEVNPELKDKVYSQGKVIWDQKVPGTQLEKFKVVIQDKYKVKFDNYWDLHDWSVNNYPQFWEEVWKFFDVIHSKPYIQPFKKVGERIVDAEWFCGAEINYAENVLRYRDDKVALICINDYGKEEKKTFFELFELVKLYASAFRNIGLQEGDIVACYISNRKEAIFAMLAAASIGAIFGGPLPFLGGKATSAIIESMNPKILITEDRYQFKIEYNLLERLPDIVNGNKSIEKVIIVPSESASELKDISNIKNSCFLREFLAMGRDSHGYIRELTFRQLPLNHPLSIAFTSGTTSAPKGIVHSAGTILSVLRTQGLHWNLDRNSVLLLRFPPGRNIWNLVVGTLSLGASLLLYSEVPEKASNIAYWNVIDFYKVSVIYYNPVDVDILEKENIVPDPDCKLEHLKVFAMAAMVTKTQNVDFLLQKVKPGLIPTALYGATELFEGISGFDYNSSAYSAEIQCPALGVDLRVLDEKGNNVVGKMGEVVIAKPMPSFPLYILNDKDGMRMNSTYFFRYEGLWNQSDVAWINPDTGGMLILGRSDGGIKRHGGVIFTEDIYNTLYDMAEISDSIFVEQKIDNKRNRCILFVKMETGYILNDDRIKEIKDYLGRNLAFFYVPDIILPVSDIPYNFNGKRMESTVRSIINTNQIPEVTNMQNPEILKQFYNIAQLELS